MRWRGLNIKTCDSWNSLRSHLEANEQVVAGLAGANVGELIGML